MASTRADLVSELLEMRAARTYPDNVRDTGNFLVHSWVRWEFCFRQLFSKELLCIFVRFELNRDRLDSPILSSLGRYVIDRILICKQPRLDFAFCSVKMDWEGRAEMRLVEFLPHLSFPACRIAAIGVSYDDGFVHRRP